MSSGQHSNRTTTPYERMLPASAPSGAGMIQNLHSKTAPPPHNGDALVSRPAPIKTVKKISKTREVFETNIARPFDNSNIEVNGNSARRMIVLALAFLVFYVLITASKLASDYSSNKLAVGAERVAQAQGGAAQISQKIDTFLIWINNGLAVGNNPSQSARLIAASPDISGALILNNDKKIIAGYPKAAMTLAKANFDSVQNGNVEINSVVSNEGETIPIIIQKSPTFYTVVAIDSGAFLKTYSQDQSVISALITPAGQAIDGGQRGIDLTEDHLLDFVSKGGDNVKNIKIGTADYQLVKTFVPNSHNSLIYLDARPQKETFSFSGNLMIFAILFLGTCALLYTLLSSLYRQLHSLREIQKETEVSQQRFQAAIEGERGGVWEVDATENSCFISASFATFLGLPRKEHHMPMSKFLGLFHPEDQKHFLALTRHSHVNGEFDFDIRVAHLPLILQCRGRHSTRSGRELKQIIVGVAIDITAQRTAQARLRAAETRLHSALSSMTDSFAVWDATGRLVIWNKRFQDFFNFADGQLTPGVDRASVNYHASQSIAEIHNDFGDINTEMVNLKDGRSIRFKKSRTSDGGEVSVGTDITELRNREFELEENERTLTNTVEVLRVSQARIVELAERYEKEKIRAEDASQSKSDFLASMSHELRTPLNAINGFSDIMKKEMFGPLGDPRYKEYVSDILFSGQHLLALINEILDMSKIEAGKMTLHPEILFMHELVGQVIRIVRGKVEDAELVLDVNVPEVREIEADPRAVKQVLLNLMTNAIKFTPEGGRVSIGIVEKQTGLIVNVKDTGIGISQENIERLANPFEQVIDEQTKHKEGTGLGLALTKSLVELHGGKFTITSELGQGTTVSFSLPNRPIEQKSVLSSDDDVSSEISKLADDIAGVLGSAEQKSGAGVNQGAGVAQGHQGQVYQGQVYQGQGGQVEQGAQPRSQNQTPQSNRISEAS